MNLPLPLEEEEILLRRQLIRDELDAKVQLMLPHTNKLFWIIKCPCNYSMCGHMQPNTVDISLKWHPLESELAYFFLEQPYRHLGFLLYPHCIECLMSSVCGESRA